MRHKLFFAASVLLAAVACTKEIDYYNVESTELEVGINDADLVLEGKTESAKITINSNMWWKAWVEYPSDESEKWCVITPDQGFGNIEIDVTSTRNYQLAKDRTATIVVVGDDKGANSFRKEFTVVQKASSPYVELSGMASNELDVPIVKSVNVIAVKANSDWTVSSNQDWCVVSGTGNSGDGEVTIECGVNADKAVRTATVEIVSKSDASVKTTIKVLQNDVFPAPELKVTKTPEVFTAEWEPIVGAVDYQIDVNMVDGTVEHLDVATETSVDLYALKFFSTPVYAGYVELTVTAFTEDERVFSVSNSVAANSHFTSGKGTKAEPFIIADAASFRNISVANGVLAGAYYKLDMTPDMSVLGPLCSVDVPFGGVFDGNGKTISGWKAEVQADKSNNFGFFKAVAAGAEVSNLKFEGCELNLTKADEGASVSSTDNGMAFVAGINAGTISNITVTNCKISTVAGTSPLYVGAIAGQSSGKITGCVTSGGRISAAEDRNKTDEFNCGGITGYNTDKGEISNCVNGSEIIAMNNVGGIAGYNDGAVLSCANTAKITANYYFGGITGYVKTTGKATCHIKDCYNSGTLVMDEPAGFGRGAAYMGGITSRVHSTGTAIENCCNVGEMIVGISVSSSSMRIGGITGHVNNTGKILNCYFSGEITIAGNVNYGGIVGEFADKATTIQNCYSVGKLTKTDSAKGTFGDAFGKCAKSAVIKSCYALKNGGSTFVGGTSTNVSAECGYKTEAELKTQATFTGWDFDKIWKMDGYPVLRTVNIK